MRVPLIIISDTSFSIIACFIH